MALHRLRVHRAHPDDRSERPPEPREVQAGDGVIMLATPTPAYQSPAHHREECEAARRWHEVPYIVDGVLVYVDDVEQHCTTARAAGARILSEPETDEHGPRYRAEDMEGHRWMF